jgi:cation transport regulator ChaB
MAKKESGKTDMPSTIQRSDKHAQDIWRKTHNSAVKNYGEGASAHRVAYAALKHEYEKQGDRWVRKAHKGPSDPQAARGKVAQSPAEARRKAKEASREYSRSRRAKSRR